MKTYVIQHRTLTGANIDICQSENITNALKFLMKKYKEKMVKIEFIYSEEYHEENTNNHT